MTYKSAFTAALLAVPLFCALPADAQAGEYCREYTRTIAVGGRTETGYGTACLQPDGDWKVVLESGGGLNPAQTHSYYTRDLGGPAYFAPAPVTPVYYAPAPVYAVPVYGPSYSTFTVRREPAVRFSVVPRDRDRRRDRDRLQSHHHRRDHHDRHDRRNRHDRWDRHDRWERR